MKLIEKRLVIRREKLEDEVNESYVGQERVKLTWLDHVQSVIYRSRDHNITIAFPLRRKLRQTCKYECSLVKNIPTHLEDWGGKLKDQWEHLSPVRKLMSL